MSINKRLFIIFTVLACVCAQIAYGAVPGTSSRADYTASGAATVFTFTFQAQKASEVEVWVNGIKQTSGYTATINTNQATTPGGKVTFNVAPALNLLVRIQRNTAKTQETVYTPYSAFPAKTTEKALDRIVLQVQEIDRNASDAVAAAQAASLGYVWRGAWDGGTTYAKQDVVRYAGSSYAAIAASLGLTPDLFPAAWALLAQKGDAGIAGPAGPNGAGPAFGNSGVTFYVKTSTGNDSNDCLTWNSACQTILGAYDKLPADGGSIHFADQARIGGSVASQGLWFMHVMDPQCVNVANACTSMPPGWRTAKPLHLIGESSRSGQFSRKPVARILPGQPGDDWAVDVNKPVIWIAGSFVTMTFENIEAIYPPRGIILGVPSNRGNVDAMVANIAFENVSINSYGDATQIARGPTVEAQHIFWVYFRDVYFGALGTFAETGNPAIGMDAAQRGASITIMSRNGEVGGFNMKHAVVANGGIDDTIGASSWGLDVEDLVLEGDFVHSTTPAIRIRNASNYGNARFVNIGMSDTAPGSVIAVVVIDAAAGLTRPDAVVCINCASVSGLATVFGQYPSDPTITDLTSKGQAGFFRGVWWGQHDAARRGSGMSAPRGTNLYTHTAAWAPPYPGSQAIDDGVADPLGGTGAIRIRRTTNDANVDSFNIAIDPAYAATGDVYMFGAWIRAAHNDGSNASATPVSSLPGGLLEFQGTGGRFVENDNYYMAVAPVINGDGGWAFYAKKATVASVANGTQQVSFAAHFDYAHALELFEPTLYKIPAATAATLSASEIGEIFTQFIPTPPAATPGRVWTPHGLGLGVPGGSILVRGNQIDFASAAPASGTWAKGDVVFNSAATVGQPKGWQCTVAGTPGTWVSMGNL